MGPLYLTKKTIKGEKKLELYGYVYVMCTNFSCRIKNRIPYGKTHRLEDGEKGMPSFCINTKIGIGKYNFVFIQ